MQGHGIKKAVISTLALVLLAACGSAAPVPEDQFYRLSAVMTVAPQSKTLFPGTLEIDRFVADGLTAGRPIVYSEAGKPFQVKEFHYHFWTQPPTVMLRDELVTYLRRAKVADIVVTPEMRVSPDYVLTGKIKHLEQITGEPSRTLLEVELSVRRPTGGKLLFLKTYRIENESSGGVAAAVESLNTALSILYSDFVVDLMKL